MPELWHCQRCGGPVSSEAARRVYGRWVCPPCAAPARVELADEPTPGERAASGALRLWSGLAERTERALPALGAVKWPAATGSLARRAALGAAALVLLAELVAWGWLELGASWAGGSSWTEVAAYLAMILVLSGGVLLLTATARDLVRTGLLADRLSRAEWGELRARQGRARRVCGYVIGAVGLLGVVTMMLLSVEIYYAEGYHFWETGPVALLLLAAVAASVGFSLLHAASLGAAAAVDVSAARKSGAAENLLLAPRAVDYLGWAAARAQSRRGLRSLMSVLPYYALTLLWFMRQNRHDFEMAPLMMLPMLLVLVALAEMGMIQRAAAMGTWLGAAVRRPISAAVLGAGGGALLWAVRLGTFLLAGALEGRHELWAFICLCVLGDFLSFAFLTPWFMRRARAALGVPAGDGAAPRRERLGLVRPAGSPACDAGLEPWRVLLRPPARMLLVGGLVTGAALFFGRRELALFAHALTWHLLVVFGAACLLGRHFGGRLLRPERPARGSLLVAAAGIAGPVAIVGLALLAAVPVPATWYCHAGAAACVGGLALALRADRARSRERAANASGSREGRVVQ